MGGSVKTLKNGQFWPFPGGPPGNRNFGVILLGIFLRILPKTFGKIRVFGGGPDPPSIRPVIKEEQALHCAQAIFGSDFVLRNAIDPGLIRDLLEIY